MTPDYKNILVFIEEFKLKPGLYDTYDIACEYEAGCLGYSLYNQLTEAGVKCVILAPTMTLTQHMASYDEETAKIERFDAKLEEIAS